MRTADLAAIACAIAGAIVGKLGFDSLATHGYYGLILPGGLAGLAAGIPKNSSIATAVCCAVVAAAAGIVTEFLSAPFVVDPSFGYFVRHLGDLRSMTLAMITTGAVIGFYVPFRRRPGTSNPN